MKKKLVALLVAGIVSVTPICVYAKDVSVTISNEMLGDNFKDIDVIDNGDGTSTVTLNEKEQKEMKKQCKENLDAAIAAAKKDKTNCPTFSDYTYNDDLTEFQIFVGSDSPELEKTYLSMLPLMLAPMYQQISGISEDKIDYKITFSDAQTKENISSTTYKEIAESFGSMVSFNSDSTTESTETKVDKILFDTDTAKLEYTGFEFMDHSPEGTLAVLKFNYTNKTDTPSAVTSVFNAKAYQNGVELDYYMGMGNVACDNSAKTVLKDATLEVGYAYLLQDLDNPITVYMYDGYTNPSSQIQEIQIAK